MSNFVWARLFLSDGQVGLDASFANLNTSACADEELMHYLQGGMRLRRQTGAKLDTMVQVDVPGMSWGLMLPCPLLG